MQDKATQKVLRGFAGDKTGYFSFQRQRVDIIQLLYFITVA